MTTPANTSVTPYGTLPPSSTPSAPPARKPVSLPRLREMQVHGEKIETWLISVEQGGQTMIEAHISQLGQILRIRTFAGYSAAPEDLTP